MRQDGKKIRRHAGRVATLGGYGRISDLRRSGKFCVNGKPEVTATFNGI